MLEKNLELLKKYFSEKDIDPAQILQAKDFEQLRFIEEAVEAILENDVSKIMFFSSLRLVVNSYTDLLPHPRASSFMKIISLYVVIGETIAAEIPDIDISDIERKIGDLIDRSISVKPYTPKKEPKIIDLTKIDLTQFRDSYQKGR